MSRNVSKFQAAAEELVSRITSVPVDTVAAIADGQMVDGLGITPAEILEWIEIAMQIFQTIVERCDRNRGVLAKLASQTRVPQRVYVRSVSHEICAAREDRKWLTRSGQLASAMLYFGANQPQADILALVDEVANPADNWLL